jgi:hypothetical protein
MMEAARSSETSVDNHFTRQYIPEDNSERFQLLRFANTAVIIWKRSAVLFKYVGYKPFARVDRDIAVRINKKCNNYITAQCGDGDGTEAVRETYNAVFILNFAKSATDVQGHILRYVHKPSHVNGVWKVYYEAFECIFMPCFRKENSKIVVLGQNELKCAPVFSCEWFWQLCPFR